MENGTLSNMDHAACLAKDVISEKDPDIKGMDTDQDDKDNDNEANTCPLFMNGLPSDFSTNPQLSALASLLESDDDAPREELDESKIVTPKAGTCRPIRRQKSRVRRKTKPYSRPDSTKRNKGSMAEAQLFLQMWKL